MARFVRVPYLLASFLILGPGALGQQRGPQPERIDDPPGPSLNLGTSPPGTVTVGSYTSVQVNVNGAGQNILGDAANEPSIAVDMVDPSRMVIGWRQFDTIASNFRQAGYGYTQDGGTNWTFPGVFTPGIFRSDPVLDSDSLGNIYYLSLQIVGQNFNCDMFISADGGVNWSGPHFAFGGDKAWFRVDKTASVGAGNIYQAWNVAGNQYFPNIFNRSVDGGFTWSNPTEITDRPVFGTLDVDSDGILHVVGTPNQDLARFSVATSTDARFSGFTPTFTTQDVDIGGTLPFGSGPNPAGLLGQYQVAVDKSGGPLHGNIYALGSVDPSGSDPEDIHFVRSEDGGASWSAPVRVNDDGATNAWQWFGTMSVAPTGRIDVVWNDTRNSGLENISELFYSYSWDGGATWSPNVAVSPAFDSHVGWPQQDKLGDYYDMVSDAAVGNLAWAATFNGEQDVYYTQVFPDCNGNGTPDYTDIQSGTSSDDNDNGVLDECELVLTLTALVRGQQSTLTASGDLTPGERVYFGYSTSTGNGPCIFGGNLCLDLVNPVLIGSSIVAANGLAAINVNVRANAPLVQIHTQAAVKRPPLGTNSIASAVVSDTIQP